MEIALKLAWFALAFIHVTPAMVLFNPPLVEKLYAVKSDGPIGLLLTHRGALFLAVVVACLYAAFDAESRRLAFLVTMVSMVSFLFLYWRAGMPVGGLRKIATADLAGLPFLIFVGISAFGAG